MNNNEIEKRFDEKLEANYLEYINEILKLEPADIIEKAKEIAATKLVYSELFHKADMESIKYLMRFENPLEIVRDKWLEEHDVVLDEEMDHVLWSIRNYEDADQIYALDEGMNMC